MILSRKFVSDYIKLDNTLSITDIAEAMTSVGNEYDYAGPFINCTNLIIGEVLECNDIPDTHLHSCKVNIGSEVLDIICGAPNVRDGIKVIVAQNGAVLPGGTISKTIIHGYESNGMLCSIKELGLDNKFLTEKDIEGIAELGSEAKIGDDPLKYLGLDDEIIDFELTSNRGDLLSMIGMAYELGAIYKKKVNDIDVGYKEVKTSIKDEFNIDIKTDNCTMFLAKKVKNVTIKESPDFIKNRLIACGIRPINNVVDISNYVMLETGQPLHYYDANRLGKKLVVRMAKDDEKLITLDNEERILSSEDIVIANEKEPVGLAGVMGGLTTEVESDTKDIIIESAIFDSIKVRKTSKKILRSEASNRFEKGLDPKRTMLAIERSCHLLEKYADATVLSDILIYDKTNKEDKEIELDTNKVNSVLGIEIPVDIQIKILNDLGFTTKKTKNIIKVTVPTRRQDISISEDLIEEIGRIYGMDEIKGKFPKLDVIPGTYNKKYRSIKHKLADLGLNEAFSYTLIPNEEVYKFTNKEFEPILLDYPMSEDKNTLRYSLLYSLKEIYLYNKSHNQTNISIFELGKGFYKDNNEYKEDLKVAGLLAGNYYIDIPKKNVDFYTLKGIVEELLYFLGYDGRYSFVIDSFPSEFHPYQSASIIMQGKKVGVIGKIHPNVLKDDVYAFEINLSKLLINKASKMIFKEIPKYPAVKKDVAFIVDDEISVGNVISVIKKAGGKLLRKEELFDIYKGENVEPGKKSLAFSLYFQDDAKTLTEEEVMNKFTEIIKKVTETVSATVRDN